MKVALAAQLLSQSVADALRHLRVNLKVPKFAGSELFDILNSWNINAKGDKEPLNKTNLEEKKKDLEDLSKFLRQLRLPNGRLVSVSKRKTCNGGVTPSLSSNCSILPVDDVSDDYSLSVDGEIILDMEIFGSDNDFNNYVRKVVKGPIQRSALFCNPDDPLDLSLANVAELRGKRAITIPSQSVFILVQKAEQLFHSLIVQKSNTLSNESNLLRKSWTIDF
ncbi:hypothetical protein GHT06_002511 [Daphnia sinensis]|uniref:Transposable element P transposase-like GTP-binding insertion domain-containing protein n=1 Tax=Daphnia sinensis TaxID=1820382 RepID=A0AAD5PQA4_9CRUS|nr:hypothetical protein GHT06_002511 [Daphnia sinensis]